MYVQEIAAGADEMIVVDDIGLAGHLFTWPALTAENNRRQE